MKPAAQVLGPALISKQLQGELDESMSFITMYKLVNTFRQRDRIQGLLRPDVSDLYVNFIDHWHFLLF